MSERLIDQSIARLIDRQTDGKNIRNVKCLLLKLKTNIKISLYPFISPILRFLSTRSYLQYRTHCIHVSLAANFNCQEPPSFTREN